MDVFIQSSDDETKENIKKIESDINEIYSECNNLINAIDNNNGDLSIIYHINSLYSTIKKYKKDIIDFIKDE